MAVVNTTIFVLLVYSVVFQHADAWLRRRRRHCPPRACEVSQWSSWSSCSADKCGQQGSQRRSRTKVSAPSCGGTRCPELDETRLCYSDKREDCQLSSWSKWSACSTQCGVSGTQSSSRHRIITEQCGGMCTSTFRKTQACPSLSCLNGGSLEDKTCFCKKGYSGVCCEKEKKSSALVIGCSCGVGIFCLCAFLIGIIAYKKHKNRIRPGNTST